MLMDTNGDLKKLLLRDLAARLPYEVVVECRIVDFYIEEYAHDNHPSHIKHPGYVGKGILFLIDTLANRVMIRPILKGLKYEEKVHFEQMCNNGYASIDYCKPYLRKMSSMTEDEKKHCFVLEHEGNIEHPNGIFYRSQDYLNSIHVDYRGLIEKGLALEASDGMYNLK